MCMCTPYNVVVCCPMYSMLCAYVRCVVHPRELTEEEKLQITHSEDFLVFFDKTIRVMERALAEDSDIFFDYSGRDMEDRDGSEPSCHSDNNTHAVSNSQCILIG